jgi:hypothetical protein
VNPDLEAFVFFTNIDLTPSEEGNLAKIAKSQGIKYIEIFVFIQQKLRETKLQKTKIALK